MTDLTSIRPLRADLCSTEQMQLFAAVTSTDVARARRLLDSGVSPNSGDEDDDTPLTLAAARGHVGMIETLLAAKADVNLPGMNGHTPLRIAIDCGHLDSVKVLLKAGADPLHSSYSDMEQRDITAVMAADKNYIASRSSTEQSENIMFIVLGATDSFHMIDAAADGNPIKMQQWLDRPACDVNAYNRHGVTALLHACKLGRQDLAEQLWHAQADPNQACKYDAAITPLRMAEESGNPHLIRQIKEYIQKAEQEFLRGATELGHKMQVMKPIRFKPQ